MIHNKVIPGIDLFLKDGAYKNKRFGLITNHTGVTSTGVPTWKALQQHDYTVTAFFGPEHGLFGQVQDAIPVDSFVFSDIPVYSLFGKNFYPTEKMLQDVDILVVDIQDIGCRYYTYLYTLAYSMEACENSGIQLIVLDRPNPVGMYQIEGNIIPGRGSFLGGFELPTIYRLTIGEYAIYLKKNFFHAANLRVVPMKNYSRDMPYTDTGLPWIAPSPNIPEPLTAEVYPGTCLFEGTNVSEGRGTTKPFEIIGAPWIDGENLRTFLNSLNIPGVLFTSQYFTPVFSKYRGQLCKGICIHITDRKIFKPLLTGAALLFTIQKLYQPFFKWKNDWEESSSFFIDKLTGIHDTPEFVRSSSNYMYLYSNLDTGSKTFNDKRAELLLYP